MKALSLSFASIISIFLISCSSVNPLPQRSLSSEEGSLVVTLKEIRRSTDEKASFGFFLEMTNPQLNLISWRSQRHSLDMEEGVLNKESTLSVVIPAKQLKEYKAGKSTLTLRLDAHYPERSYGSKTLMGYDEIEKLITDDENIRLEELPKFGPSIVTENSLPKAENYHGAFLITR